MSRAFVGLCLGVSMLLGLTGPASAGERDEAASNAPLVRGAFEDWRHGRGSVFDLLHDDMVWTVAGTSPVSGTYTSRQAFMDRAVLPINARLATPITPEVEHVIAQGDTVIVIWRGTARTHGGSAYTNHYAWHLQLDGDRIVRVTAFLDTWALQALMDDTRPR